MAEQEWKEFICSSGVVLLYGPFPHGLYWDIMGRALEEHPDPEPPTKEITVVTGTETVPDLENPTYKAALQEARLGRYNLLGDAVLDLCIEVKGGMEQYEPVIQKLKRKYVKTPVPDDPDERKVWFLSKYALRTTQDWKIVGRVQRFSQIEDEEVRQRADFFRGDVEGTEGVGVDAPGAPA